MANFYADFQLVSDSMDTLQSLGKKPDPELYSTVRNNCSKIMDCGDKHDHCFSSINSSVIEKAIDSVSTSIFDFNSSAQQALDVILDYSMNGVNKVNLFGDEYTITSASFSHLGEFFIKRYNNGESLSNLISSDEITAGYDFNRFNDLLNGILANSPTQREKAVNAAIFMATIFPHLPYFWGGGHYNNQLGVDPTWGSPRVVTAPHDDTSGTSIPYSMDCSGYVDWLLYNSNVSTSRADYLSLVGDYDPMGSREPITSPGILDRVRVGDLAEMHGHVGFVVAKTSDTIVVSHCSGSGNGMNLTAIDVNTGLVAEDSSLPERVGDEYFTDIVHINYDDELDDEDKEKE